MLQNAKYRVRHFTQILCSSLLITACQSTDRGAMHIVQVSPEHSVEGVITLIHIFGQNFWPAIETDFTGKGRIDIKAAFQVKLGDHNLLNVQQLDQSQLSAQVLPELTPGVYTLSVTDSRQQKVEKPNAYTIMSRPYNQLFIEDAPNGLGKEIHFHTLFRGQTMDLYAIARQDGIFVEDSEGQWHSSNSIASLSAIHGATTRLFAEQVGETVITLNSDLGFSDQTETITIQNCTTDVECDDMNICNGGEICQTGMCLSSEALDCSLDPCFEDACDPIKGCLEVFAVYADQDRDEFISIACGGNDCDDDPADSACGSKCYPGAEIDPCDGFDNDCDGSVDEDIPLSTISCGVGACENAGTISCTNAELKEFCTPLDPLAANDQTCDDLDDDCDNEIDEDYPITSTQCGVGVCSGNTGELRCENAVIVDTCDANAGASMEGPVDDDSCDDQQDNDCDGRQDLFDPDCENNPPIAIISVNPAAGTLATVFQFSAQASRDDIDSFESLVFSWDWNNDGVFDATGSEQSYQFIQTGLHLIRLEIRDSGGLSDLDVFVVVVAESEQWLELSTEADENDANATSDNPLGTGLSLREAIHLALLAGDTTVIFIPLGYHIVLQSVLPELHDIHLIGDGTLIEAAQADIVCFNVGNNNQILGVEVSGCKEAFHSENDAAVNHYARCRVHHNEVGFQLRELSSSIGPNNHIFQNEKVGIRSYGSNHIYDNFIYDQSEAGIEIEGVAAVNSLIFKNVIFGNKVGIVLLNQVTQVQVVFNTISDNQLGIDLSPTATNIDLRNNLIVFQQTKGLYASNDQFSFMDYNLFFANTEEHCSPCTALNAQNSEADPLFIYSADNDYRFGCLSPARDSGLAIGFDVNGYESGDYNNSDPDRGAWEYPD